MKDLSEQHKQMMDVHSFDLFAQVEAMLRHARQYQREVQRLRGALGPGQTDTSDREPADAIAVHLNQMRKACASFNATLDEIADSLEKVKADSRSPHVS